MDVEISVENVDNFLNLNCGIELCKALFSQVKVCGDWGKGPACGEKPGRKLEDRSNNLSKKWANRFIFGFILQGVINRTEREAAKRDSKPGDGERGGLINFLLTCPRPCAKISKLASVAQSVEQLIRNQQVVCSSHITSSIRAARRSKRSAGRLFFIEI